MTSPLLAMATAVDATVGTFASNRVLVVASHAIAVNERALARAVREVLNSREPNNWFDSHGKWKADSARAISCHRRSPENGAQDPISWTQRLWSDRPLPSDDTER